MQSVQSKVGENRQNWINYMDRMSAERIPKLFYIRKSRDRGRPWKRRNESMNFSRSSGSYVKL